MFKTTFTGIWRYVDRNGHHYFFITVPLECLVVYGVDRMREAVLG